MSNLSCEVIRDLLPGCVWGACGDESRAIVEAHLAACPDCTEALSALRAQEAEASAGAQKQPKKRKRWPWLLGGALLIALALVLPWVHQELRVNARRAMPLDWYALELTQTSRGEVLMTGLPTQAYEVKSMGSSWGEGGPLYVSASFPILPRKATAEELSEPPFTISTGLYLREGKLYWDQDEEEWGRKGQVEEIRRGDESTYRLLFPTGKDLPLCSPELEQRFALRAELSRLEEETEQKQEQLTADYEQKRALLREQLTANYERERALFMVNEDGP